LALWATLPGRTFAQQAPGRQVSLHPADERWAAVAERVPGFAGLWFEGSTLVLALADTARVADALREVADEIAPRTYSAVRVQPARFDFAQLHEWRQLVFDHLDAIGWTMLSIQETRNRVLVAVRDSSRLAPAQEALLTLGIPSAAFELEVGYLEFGEPTPLEPRPRDEPKPREEP
jgi:hypothetical protein